jgi:Cellulase (glycosyl hydrolase family 5)
MKKTLSRREFLRGAALASIGAVAVGGSTSCTAVTLTGRYPDAITHASLDALKDFTWWLSHNGVRGYVGEVGWPSDLQREEFADQEQWAGMVGNWWWPEANRAKLWVTTQECNEWQRWGGYFASVYASRGDGQTRALSKANYQAALVEANLATPECRRGMNFSGGQSWDTTKNTVDNPGVFDVDYWYAGISQDPITGQNSFEYLKSRGIELVRLGFRWERMQPQLNKSLSSVELGRYRAAIRSAGEAGLQVIVDLHNYGGYYFSSGRAPLTSKQLTTSHFVDVWKRLSVAFRADPTVVAYDLMNEPYNEGGIQQGSYTSKAKAWEAITQKTVNAIRAGDDPKKIMVPVYCGMGEVSSTHPKSWIANGGDHRYTVHDYFDHWFGPGTGGGYYKQSYGEEDAYYASKGF